MILNISGIWEFPGRPVVRTGCFHCCGQGSIPGREAKIPQTEQHGQNINQLIKKNQ